MSSMTSLLSSLQLKHRPRFVSVLIYVVAVVSFCRIPSLVSFDASNYLHIDHSQSLFIPITASGDGDRHGDDGNSSIYFISASATDEAAATKSELTKPRTETNLTTTMTMSLSSQTFDGTSLDNSTDTERLIIWRKRRSTSLKLYNSWFVGGSGKGELLPENADGASTGGGPILDFFIAGFPKCGTTALMRTLSAVTTMPPDSDVCTPPHATVYYAYNNWADEFGNGAGKYSETKPLKGSKCPATLEGNDLNAFGRQLPKTNLIVGIRHPVLWFQSFVNMRLFWKHSDSNFDLDGYVNSILLNSTVGNDNHECRKDLEIFCVARSRFHLSLARLGKTPLDDTETQLLQSELYQTKRRRNDTSMGLRKYPVKNNEDGVSNRVFIFESSQGKEEYFYKELAQFVNIDRSMLPPITFNAGNGLNKKNHQQLQTDVELFDICLPKFDHVRKEIMPISYVLGTWLLQYLIPASFERDDLVIPNTQSFATIVEGFLKDPCDDPLIRNTDDGEFYTLGNDEKHDKILYGAENEMSNEANQTKRV